MSDGANRSLHALLGFAWPFILSQILYWFILYIPVTQPSLRAVVVKAVPLMTLISYAVSQESPDGNKQKDRFTNLLTAGLAFSLLGDVIMVYERYFFLYGVIAFAVAHVAYILAFGFEPLRPGLFFTLLVPSAPYMLFILTSVEQLWLWFVLPLYGALITAMTWRALAFATSPRASHCSLPAWLPGVGGLVFMISDCVLVFNRFYRPFSGAQQVIMATYYTGQFLITTALVGISDRQDKFLTKEVRAKIRVTKKQR